MVEILLLAVSLVARTAADEPAPKGDEPLATTTPADDARQAQALAEYNALRDKAKNTADAQWKLALWCEQHGLAPEALVHLATVVKLDPKRLGAWKKLGFKKHNGHWMTEEQIADETQQRAADKLWGPRLAKLHKMIHDPDKRKDAETELAKLDDPLSVPSIFRELATRGPGDQTLAIQVFGQIQGQAASKSLALLSIYGASADVRRRATETLRSRPANEFAEMLVKLIVDPLKFEVRPVGGPGSPGVLFVEGEKFNVSRVYAPPLPPILMPTSGDLITWDAFGMPILTRPVPGGFVGRGGPTVISPAPANTQTLAPVLGKAGIKLPSSPNTGPAVAVDDGLDFRVGAQFSATQNLINAQRAAISAQQQLQNDVRLIELFNKDRKSFRERVVDVLKDATGENPGDDRSAWTTWLARRQGYAKDDKARPKPTLTALVPLAYNPPFAQLVLARLPAPPDD